MAQSAVKDVGRRIRQLRSGRVGPGLTQAELSRRARISVAFLSMIERGERSPHIETLARIAAALEVRLADLFPPGGDAVEPVYRPLLEACRRLRLGRRDVERLTGMVRTLFA